METTANLERVATRKIFLRLLPYLFLLYVIAFLDRTNVSFAQLTMGKSIGLGTAAYGFGAGVFFIGYFLMEIPGNLIMYKWSVRKWIGRIMVSWGIVACAFAFLHTPLVFSYCYGSCSVWRRRAFSPRSSTICLCGSAAMSAPGQQAISWWQDR